MGPEIVDERTETDPLTALAVERGIREMIHELCADFRQPPAGNENLELGTGHVQHGVDLHHPGRHGVAEIEPRKTARRSKKSRQAGTSSRPEGPGQGRSFRQVESPFEGLPSNGLSNFYYLHILGSRVPNILEPDGLAGCFRCAYVWPPRSTAPRRCPRCKSTLWDVPKLQPIRKGKGLGIPEILGPKRVELTAALQANRARNPRVFGSVARSEASARSDLDLLVDFDADASVFDHMGLLQDLERLFGRKVDVADPRGLHWLIRPQVLFEAVPV